MKCKICEARKARRYCPGVLGEICPQCCGAGRETTVDCPLDCRYLREAHLHERLPAIDYEAFPNQDIRVTEEFLKAHDTLVIFLGATLLAASGSAPGAIDFDFREALEALIRTYRTLQSGLYYETVPANPIAAAIHGRVQEGVREFSELLAKKGPAPLRDAEVLGVLVFLQRFERVHNNGRPRGRAFIDFLRASFPILDAELASSPSPLIHI